MTGMARLLVVEDDATIGGLLEPGLRAHGNDVRWVRSGKEALVAVGAVEFDLVLLDLGLPDTDGVDVCRRLRSAQPGCVLVILTARREEMAVVVGLDAGADDYLTKPFRFAELLARIRAHLRRGAPTLAHQPALQVGALMVDGSARRCTLGGVEVSLRAKEFDLLARLAAEAGVAISRERLMCDVWDENWFGSTKTLDVHMAAVRRRLTDAERELGNEIAAPRITTLRGRGYRMEAD